MEPKDKLNGQLDLLNKLREIRPASVIYYAVMPITDMLVVLFIGLKLTNLGVVGHWPWWIVLSPFWGSIILSIVKSVAKSFADKVRLKMMTK